MLVDAGVAASRIAASLDALGIDIGKLRGALVTHEHIDHIRAVGVLARRYDLSFYANASTWAAIDGLGCAGKIPQRNRIVIETGRDFIGICAYPRFRYRTTRPSRSATCCGERESRPRSPPIWGT